MVPAASPRVGGTITGGARDHGAGWKHQRQPWRSRELTPRTANGRVAVTLHSRNMYLGFMDDKKTA